MAIMEKLALRSPSVGSILKKIMVINPDLTAPEYIDLIRQSVMAQSQAGLAAGEFAQAELIDEEKCIGLARATMRRPS